MTIINKFNKPFAIILMFFGIILLCIPEQIISIFSWIIGLLIISKSISSLVGNLKIGRGITFNLFSILFGIFFILEYNVFVSFLPFVFGIFIFGSSVNKLSMSLAYKASKQTYLLSFLFSILGICVGLLLFINPFGSVIALMRIIGAYLIILGIHDFFDSKIVRTEMTRDYKKTKTISKKIKIIDAD
ncbi:MAG: DUF308 domain-containing protein [Mycoplasmatota bacterium]